MADEQEGTETIEGEKLTGTVTRLEHEIRIEIRPEIHVPRHNTPDIRAPVTFSPNVTILASRYDIHRTIILGVIALALVIGLFVR